MRHPITRWSGLRAGVVFAAFGGVLIGCGSDSPSGPGETPPSIEGIYDLESINGSALPWLKDFETAEEAIFDVELGCEQYVTGGRITVRNGNRYDRNEVRLDGMCDDPADNGQPFDNEYTGTWTLNGNSLSLVEEVAIGTTTGTGTWNNDVITLTLRQEFLGDVETTIRVYRR